MKEGELTFWILALFICALIWAYRTFILPLIRERELKIRYQHMAEPVLIIDDLSGNFWQRVELAKSRFVESGNGLAIRQIPVIAIPLGQEFVIEWFEKSYPFSSVNMTCDKYVTQSAMLYNTLYSIWLKEMRKEFGDSFMYENARHEEPFDPANIWRIPNH